jgi:hypothetical protein
MVTFVKTKLVQDLIPSHLMFKLENDRDGYPFPQTDKVLASVGDEEVAVVFSWVALA